MTPRDDLAWYVWQKEYDFEEDAFFWSISSQDEEIDAWMRSHAAECISSAGFGRLWRISDRRFVEFVLRFPSDEFPTQPFRLPY